MCTFTYPVMVLVYVKLLNLYTILYVCIYVHTYMYFCMYVCTYVCMCVYTTLPRRDKQGLDPLYEISRVKPEVFPS